MFLLIFFMLINFYGRLNGFVENIGLDYLFVCQNDIRMSNNFEFVAVALHSKMILSCHYCSENFDSFPKLWMKRSLVSEEFSEVDIGMHAELTDNRLAVTPSHSLVFNEVLKIDEGVYQCRKDNRPKNIYLIDVVKENMSVTHGDIKNWEKFQRETYGKIDENLFDPIKKLGFLLEMKPVWSKWSQCDGCLEKKVKKAECQIFVTDSVPEDLYDEDENEEKKFFKKVDRFSCFSIMFSDLFPNISKKLESIGIFAITEKCYAPCIFSSGTTFPKYKNTVYIKEGSHIKFICPEATNVTEILWKKDGFTLFRNSQQGHIFINMKSNLYIDFATKEEAGNYTCYVGGKKIHEIILKVKLNSKLTKEGIKIRAINGTR